MQTYNLKKNLSIMVEGSRTLTGTTDEAPEDSVPGHGVWGGSCLDGTAMESTIQDPRWHAGTTTWVLHGMFACVWGDTLLVKYM